ncbi:MAG: sigma 54-interacting transcriptional regulator [Paracoccaceae bacterium]
MQQGDAAARMLYGQSEVAEALRERVRAAARSSAGVLVSGEPGTGIPKVAEVIHLLSAASMHPFVKLTAGSADADRLDDGFHRAEGGTLFLDEVAALGPAAQFALLERLDGESRAGHRGHPWQLGR